MFLRVTCISLSVCVFSQIAYSSPFFGNFQNDPNSSESPLGNLLRFKAQLFAGLARNIQHTFQRGIDAFSNNFNNLGNLFPNLIGITNRVIDDGFAAGRQYGSVIFEGVMIVPKTITDLVSALTQNNAYINMNAARSLSYVNGKPNYLFQYVDRDGRIIPITAEVAHKLVPTLNI